MFEINEDRLFFIGEYPRTLEEAWDITIKKWETVIENPGVDDSGAMACGLCMLFFDNDCIGCPINKSGYRYCIGTPYTDYAVDGGDTKYAKAELEFLKKLRGKCI